jgi:hypothetical protein
MPAGESTRATSGSRESVAAYPVIAADRPVASAPVTAGSTTVSASLSRLAKSVRSTSPTRRACELAAGITRSSGRPKFTPRNGTARPSRIATTGSAESTGRRITNVDSRLQNPVAEATALRRGPTRSMFTLGPSTSSTAGSVISEPAAATATTAIPA